MDIVLRGWKRVVHDHSLMKHDISEVTPSNPELYHVDEVYIRESDSGLRISSEVRNLAIDGSFQVEVGLTKEEIINLASIALANEPFGEVIDALSNHRK